MLPLSPRSRTVLLAALAALLLPPLMGSQGGCDCRPDVGDPDEDTADDRDYIPMDRKLQVSRVVPDVVAPGEPFTADILGSGLQKGAAVKVGLTSASEVTVPSDSRLSIRMPALSVGEYDVTVTNPDGETVTLRRALLVRVRPGVASTCDPVTVYFEFDRDSLTAQSRDTLDPVIPCLIDVRGRVRIEGHADERGTTDYNLALGQRRADSVQRYLIGQAVPVSKLRTVSYGEERPADPASNERAWARNRRAEILVEDR